MIKVRILKQLTGAAGAVGLVAGAGTVAGCASDVTTQGDEEVGSRSAGTGHFDLSYDPSTPSFKRFHATNSIDEFVRVGEKMHVRLGGGLAWELIHPAVYNPKMERLKALKITLEVEFDRGEAGKEKQALTFTKWEGERAYEYFGTTEEFVVPTGTVAIGFFLDVEDPSDAPASKKFSPTDFGSVPVFGGELPNRTIVFDTLRSDYRQRIIEGGDIAPGSDVAITYTDWRAQTLVDSSRIDRYIGKSKGFGRFGEYEMPLFGKLEYEVSYAGQFGDEDFGGETALVANTDSRVLGRGRTAYEGRRSVPGGAKSMGLAFHVKVFLVADYSTYGNVVDKRYQDGERVLVRDVWDNENGAPADNWDFDVKKPSSSN